MKYVKLFGTICFFFLQTTLSFGQNSKHAQQIISLINYISKDYSKAVAPTGIKIINQDEIIEMEQFIQDALKLFQESLVDHKNHATILKKFTYVEQLIKKREKPEKISKKAYEITQDLIKYFNIHTFPETTIDLNMGRGTFNNYCSSCHGINGKGHPILIKTMNPPPADLTSKEGETTQTAFSINNTLQTGIPNTAMISFSSKLTTKELWDVSFYVMGLSHKKVTDTRIKPETIINDLSLSLEKLATLTDEKLQNKIQEKNLNYNLSPKRILSIIRTNTTLLKTTPIRNQISSKKTSPLEGLQIALNHIRKLKNNLTKLTPLEIRSTLIESYLEGFEKSETTLTLLNPTICSKIEKSFINIRSLEAHNSKFIPVLTSIENDLLKAQNILRENKNKKGYPWDELIASLTIILREGLEAFLIVSTLLALISSAGISSAKKYIHAAWISALAAGFVTYLTFSFILSVSGSTRELIEAISTSIAVALLFYTGYWLLSQSERIAWGKFLKAKTRKALFEKKLWTIFGVAFIAVYRETAETILFYQALTSTASHTHMVGIGFLLGLAILLSLCFSIQKYQVNIPIQKFFRATGLLMFVISIILSGKAMYELIEAGYIDHTYLEWFPTLSFLGIYPIRETILVQISLLFLAIVIYSIHEKNSQPLPKQIKI